MNSEPKNPRPAWAGEPAPLCDKEAVCQTSTDPDRGVTEWVVPIKIASDLERRLRHARKIAARMRQLCGAKAGKEMGWVKFDGELEQRLSETERTLTP